MGIYDIYMGKGIIIPVKRFVRHFLDTVKEFHTDGGDDTETLEKVAKKRLGPDYMICSLGHDALESRDGDMQVFEDDDDHREAFDMIKEWRKEVAKDNDLPITSLWCGDLMFVGYHKSLEREFSYYVKAPEILYGMAAILPKIVEIYPIMKNADCSKLEEEFGQKPCIWTFAPDCACCG